MPYELVQKGGEWIVRNKETGKLHAKGTTKAKAQAQLRLLHGIDNGWKPTGEKK